MQTPSLNGFEDGPVSAYFVCIHIVMLSLLCNKHINWWRTIKADIGNNRIINFDKENSTISLLLTCFQRSLFV